MSVIESNADSFVGGGTYAEIVDDNLVLTSINTSSGVTTDTNYTSLYGLDGNDTLGGAAHNGVGVLVGGPGDDLYQPDTSGNTIVIVEDGNSGGDALQMTGAFGSYGFSQTSDGDLVIHDGHAGSSVVVANWLTAGDQIETFTFGGVAVTTAQIEAAVAAQTASGDDVLASATLATVRTDISTAIATEANLELGAHHATIEQGNPDGDIYRFYNTVTEQHFYTESPAEVTAVIENDPQYHYEGEVFKAAVIGTDLTDVFRFYDTATQDHFYTTDATERDYIIAHLSDYHYEGVAFAVHSTQSAGTVPVYRFYDVATQGHFYTANATEAAHVEAALPEYHYEGIAFYAHS